MTKSMPMPTRPDERTRGVKIKINGTSYRTPDRVMTGGELLALAGLPPENQLFLEVPGPGDDEPVGADQEVKLRAGMCFYDVPVGTFG